MKRLLILAVASLGVLLVGTTERAAAQYYPQVSPYPYPTQSPLSPDLGLLRGNNRPALNYFLGVLPDQARRSAAQQLMTPEYGALPRRPGIDERDDFIPTLPETGHPVRFQSYGGFYTFPNQQGQRPNFLNPTNYQAGIPGRPATPGPGR
ncbi:MAG TPA: hypothetical protein VEL76_21680 [Gemmataceae bacterium]|nr:hypothetical protein [Gemmataceae bacterium]